MKKHQIVSVLVSALVLASWGVASAQADHHAKAKSIKASAPIPALSHVNIDTSTAVALVDTRTAVLKIDTSTVLTHFDTSTAIAHDSGEIGDDDGKGDGKGDDDSHSASTLPTLGAISLPANRFVAPPRIQEFNNESAEKDES